MRIRNAKSEVQGKPENRFPKAAIKRGSLFGFRASGLFRLSAFGLRILATLPALPAFAAVTNAPAGRIPDLQPPLPEIPPTFWEAHDTQILAGAALTVALALPLARWLLRQARRAPEPADMLARRALEALRGRPDDAATAAEVAHHLRSFTQAALNLPSGELTTDELLTALRRGAAAPAATVPATVTVAGPASGPATRATTAGGAPAPLLTPRLPLELRDALAGLLRDCDALHFAPIPPAPPPGLADRALEIVHSFEALCQQAASSNAGTASLARKPSA